MKVVSYAINPKNGLTDTIELSEKYSEKILHNIKLCKWYAEPNMQNTTEDSLHMVGLVRGDFENWMKNKETFPLRCRCYQISVDSTFPDTGKPVDMKVVHGNTVFSRSEHVIQFDSVVEQVEFWRGIMSNMMTPEEIEAVNKAEVESDDVESDGDGSKDEDTCKESLDRIGQELGRIADIYEMDVTTKMLDTYSKIKNVSDFSAIEEKIISLWNKHLDKCGKD